MNNSLAKRDRTIRQITEHLNELNKMLNKNALEIENKEKTNKHLRIVNEQFKEYNKSMRNAREEQIRLFNVLKSYLTYLKNEENPDEVDEDLKEIENELNKIKG